MSLLIQPKQKLPDINLPGVDKDGNTVKTFNILKDFAGSYLVVFFFRLGSQEEAVEVLEFSKLSKDFKEAGCNILGVTSESPLSIKRWMVKDQESGGFNKNLGFPIISDKDLSLAMEMGVAKKSGLPSYAALIVDNRSVIRYCQVNRHKDIKINVPEIIRLVAAYKITDAKEVHTAPEWKPGDDDNMIPRDYQEKKKWYQKNFGGQRQATNASPQNDKTDPVAGENMQAENISNTAKV